MGAGTVHALIARTRCTLTAEAAEARAIDFFLDCVIQGLFGALDCLHPALALAGAGYAQDCRSSAVVAVCDHVDAKHLLSVCACMCVYVHACTRVCRVCVSDCLYNTCPNVFVNAYSVPGLIS